MQLFYLVTFYDIESIINLASRVEKKLQIATTATNYEYEE